MNDKNTPYPNVLIAGLAKTGTTILFSRVRESMSPKPETFFEPSTADTLRQILACGKRRPTLTKCLSGHVVDKLEILSTFSHPILIIRDPRDQLVSEMLYEFFKFHQNRDTEGYRRALELLSAKVQNPENYSCSRLFASIRTLAIQQPVKRSMVKLLNRKYLELERMIETLNPLVVRYEDIIDDRVDALAEFLGVDQILKTEVDEDVKRVRRSGGYGEWRQWLTPEDLDEFTAEMGEVMKRHDYTQCDFPDKQIIAPETSLRYIRQFEPEA